jgi:pSer/pThr/pTyr-binding forkhead associated (FHA) protein
MVILKSLNEQIIIEIREGQNLLLGRLLKCDIALEDPSISSQHARLNLKNHQLRVVDLDSTNGTRLNYSLLSAPAYLQDGDTIEFGNLTFVVDGPDLTAPAEMNLSAQTLTSLEPIDASQRLEDTMLNLNLSEAELDAAHQVPPPAETDIPPENVTDHNQPVRLAFLLSLILMAIAGILLLRHLWKIPPQV